MKRMRSQGVELGTTEHKSSEWLGKTALNERQYFVSAAHLIYVLEKPFFSFYLLQALIFLKRTEVKLEKFLVTHKWPQYLSLYLRRKHLFHPYNSYI